MRVRVTVRVTVTVTVTVSLRVRVRVRVRVRIRVRVWVWVRARVLRASTCPVVRGASRAATPSLTPPAPRSLVRVRARGRVRS